MIKATLLWGGLLVVCSAALLRTQDRNVVEGCKSENEIWGSEDGTKFYFCIGDNMAIEQICDPGTFFVKNATVSGCVPLDEVAGNCINHEAVKPCEGDQILQPQSHVDPTKYYFCPTVGATPIALPCADNKAFANQNGYLGCFEWTLWRKIRGCEQ